jgi:hypothetical protein
MKKDEKVLEEIRKRLVLIRKGRKDLTAKMEGDLVLHPDLDTNSFKLVFAYWDGCENALDSIKRMIRKSALVPKKSIGPKRKRKVKE